jgi:hypothetical protein
MDVLPEPVRVVVVRSCESKVSGFLKKEIQITLKRGALIF